MSLDSLEGGREELRWWRESEEANAPGETTAPRSVCDAFAFWGSALSSQHSGKEAHEVLSKTARNGKRTQIDCSIMTGGGEGRGYGRANCIAERGTEGE